MVVRRSVMGRESFGRPHLGLAIFFFWSWTSGILAVSGLDWSTSWSAKGQAINQRRAEGME
jgi:hypothetical protein